MQNAKIIDVTRSFVPVDANEYPENLHGTGGEDYPEERRPVIPYIGWNFLPTAYGYKSFFGTNSYIGIDTLAPNKPDHVFLFQTLAYKNVIIALCDTGIWVKEGDVAGAWTQLIELNAPADDVFYEWYFFTIKNKLYCFRANGDAFYEIDTDINAAVGVSVATKIPSFITPTAQLGMFRLGGRIGFWDGTNAIAWSSPDDLTDFTPAVLTGANVTTFNSVLGKISQIRAHGRNAVIYASKSIVGLVMQAGETFLVRAESILQKAGVPYARQSVEGASDTVHFVYTTTGIYKIENGRPEIIVPEVFDYFKKVASSAIYLRFLQGRYLAFECVDVEALNGNPQFTEEQIPAGSLTFPGSTSLEQSYSADVGSLDLCQITSQVSAGLTDEQKAQASSDISNGWKTGTSPQPLYTCHLSRNGALNPSEITWDATPCAFVNFNGVTWEMSPDIPGNTLGSMTTDSTGKTSSFGPDAWVDGKWTMQRFVQAQTAIWDKEAEQAQAVIDIITSRAFSENVASVSNTCVVSNPDYSYCALGDFVSKYSDPKFGYNGCSFWLTRYALEAKRLRTKSRTTTTCDNSSGTQTALDVDHYELWNGATKVGGNFATKEAAADSISPGAGYTVAYFPDNWSTNAPGSPVYSNGAWMALNPDGSGSGFEVKGVWIENTPGRGAQIIGPGPAVVSVLLNGYFDQLDASSSINEVEDTLTGVLGVESAYCELTHWKYTAADGTVSIVPASSCNLTDDKYPGTPSSGGTRAVPSDDLRPSVTQADGSFCGTPFEAPDLIDLGISWPEQSITYPETSFLLQDGGIAPKYPTFVGAFVYDTHLKKWGKLKLDYKQLLDYSPINSESISPISYGDFGILAGAVKDDGLIYLFDDKPSDSKLTWGKIGFYRQGVTDCQEMRFDFASKCSGTLTVDISLDGQSVVDPLAYSVDYVNVSQVIGFPPYSGKWFNISLTGKFDVSYAEFKGLKKGRR